MGMDRTPGPILPSAPLPQPAARWRLLHSGWRLSPEGVLWIAILGLLLTVSIAKNINLLALLGYVLLAVLVLSAAVVGRRLGRLEARRVLDEYLFAGTSVHLEVRLHNTSPDPVVGVRIEDVGAAHAVRWFFDRLEGDARRTVTAELILPRRGWYDFAPLRASSSYPFGLVLRRVVVGLPARVLVLPRLGKVVRDRLRQHLRGADPHGERVHRHGWRHDAAQADFHGLRPFRPGDSPRWIHWRTSARRGELMVREFEDVPGDDLVLILDPGTAAGEPFEDLVSLAATLVWEWNTRRGDRLVFAVHGPQPVVHDGWTGPDHARRLLECLALLAPTPGEPPDAGLLAEGLGEHLPSTATLVVVTLAGGDGLADTLESRLARPVTSLDLDQLCQLGVYTPP